MNAEPFSRLEACGLGVSRPGRQLVCGLDLKVEPGNFVAVTGVSGAGKSSLLACLAGFLSPERGSLVYRCNEQCSHSPEKYRHRMGFVFQHLCLSLNSSVETNVLCGLLGQRAWWETACGFRRCDRSRCGALLERLGLAGCERVPAAHLSGGERQRVALARALMCSPEVLIADEPVSHLDSAMSERVIAWLRELCHEQGCTVVCALHDEELVRRFADYNLVIDRQLENGWTLRDVA